jgi:hypothetical protein
MDRSARLSLLAIALALAAGSAQAQEFLPGESELPAYVDATDAASTPPPESAGPSLAEQVSALQQRIGFHRRSKFPAFFKPTAPCSTRTKPIACSKPRAASALSRTVRIFAVPVWASAAASRPT